MTLGIALENFGNVPLSDVNVTADLATELARANSFTVTSVVSSDFVVNPVFDGIANTALLDVGNDLEIGETGTVELTFEVNIGNAWGRYEFSNLGWATSPAGEPVDDPSQDGTDPDPDDEGDPEDDNVPTVIDLIPASLGIPIVGFPGALAFIFLISFVALAFLRNRIC